MLTDAKFRLLCHDYLNDTAIDDICHAVGRLESQHRMDELTALVSAQAA